jgi:hypothetical protein
MKPGGEIVGIQEGRIPAILVWTDWFGQIPAVRLSTDTAT